jgi:hypothetical protein
MPTITRRILLKWVYILIIELYQRKKIRARRFNITYSLSNLKVFHLYLVGI